jgi:hypothetical protein
VISQEKRLSVAANWFERDYDLNANSAGIIETALRF